MKKLRLMLSFTMVCLILLSLTACGGGNAAQSPDKASDAPAKVEKQFISIATASLGGSYYPIGVGMSEVFQANIPGVEAKVEVTGGATENPKLVGAGDSDIGFTNANLAYAAYNGTGIFAGSKYEDLRVMFGGVAPGTIHMVVRDESNIKTYADLKGRKVAVGPQGGGGLSMLPELFAEYGFTMEDINASYMSFDEGVQAVIDNHVEAALVQAPHPAPAVMNIQGAGVKFRLIEMTDAERDAFLEKYPYYNKVDLPAEVYGTAAAVKTFGTSNIVVINSKLDEELVYQMTKAVFENLDDIHAVHPSAGSIKVETALSNMIPMHPGAERYLVEAGAK
jgi:TRAP transporter TAXI family solute receptor